jgi:hypothetical protein
MIKKIWGNREKCWKKLEKVVKNQKKIDINFLKGKIGA